MTCRKMKTEESIDTETTWSRLLCKLCRWLRYGERPGIGRLICNRIYMAGFFHKGEKGLISILSVYLAHPHLDSMQCLA